MVGAYVLRGEPDEIGVQLGLAAFKVRSSRKPVFPGGDGLVVRQEVGIREPFTMKWGFPDNHFHGEHGVSVTPASQIDDVRQPDWYGLVSKAESRCIVPATAFTSEAPVGEAGDQSWFRLLGQPVFALAALWRGTYEWGPAFSIVMTDALLPGGSGGNAPLLLHPHEYDTWLFGSHDDALALHARAQASGSIQTVHGSTGR